MPDARDSAPPSDPLPRRRIRPPIDLPSAEPLRRRAVPYVLALAFVAILGLGSESIRAVESVVAAAAFPAVVVVLGVRPFRASSHTALVRAAMAAAALTILASEAFLYRELFPAAPLAQATLTMASPDASVHVPDSVRRFEVVVHGRLKGESGNAEARYVVELQRGESHDRVDGEMTRHEGRAPRRSISMTRGAGSTSQESGRREVELSGAGPVALHLAELGTGAQKTLEVSLFPRALPERVVAGLFGALVIASFVVQAVGGRKGVESRLTATVAIAGVYTMYMQRYLDADDALMTVLPAMVVSFVLGGAGGLILGWIAGWFGKKPAA